MTRQRLRRAHPGTSCEPGCPAFLVHLGLVYMSCLPTCPRANQQFCHSVPTLPPPSDPPALQLLLPISDLYVVL